MLDGFTDRAIKNEEKLLSFDNESNIELLLIETQTNENTGELTKNFCFYSRNNSSF